MDIGLSYYHIGAVKFGKGDHDGALISFEKAKAIFTRELGLEHPRTVQTKACIDSCKQRMDPNNKAVEFE